MLPATPARAPRLVHRVTLLAAAIALFAAARALPAQVGPVAECSGQTPPVCKIVETYDCGWYMTIECWSTPVKTEYFYFHDVE